MAVLLPCGCGNNILVDEDSTGKGVRCPKCQHQFVVRGSTASRPQGPGNAKGSKKWQRAGVAFAAVVLACLALLLSRSQPSAGSFAGSWVLDPQSAQDSHPLLASAQNGITLDIQPDGTCVGSIAGETKTGKWKAVEKDGQTVGVEVTFPGSGPYQRASTAMGDDGMQVTFPNGGGTFNMARGGGGAGGGGANSAARPAPQVRALPPPPIRAGSDGNNSGSANYSLIENNLYMGGLVAAPPPGTKATVNLCQNQDTYTTPVYLWTPINDGPPAPSIAWLEQMVAFVSEHRSAGQTTYVHCLGGASRSGLVTTAYIMFEHHWGRDQALQFVKSKRPQTNPNSAFLQLLSQYQQVLLGQGTGSGAGSPP